MSLNLNLKPFLSKLLILFFLASAVINSGCAVVAAGIVSQMVAVALPWPCSNVTCKITDRDYRGFRPSAELFKGADGAEEAQSVFSGNRMHKTYLMILHETSIPGLSEAQTERTKKRDWIYYRWIRETYVDSKYAYPEYYKAAEKFAIEFNQQMYKQDWLGRAPLE